jgi:hypothetical protein
MTDLLEKLSRGDVFWMFTIAGLGMLTLCAIGLMVSWVGVPDGAGEILGVVIAMIGGAINSVINAIRGRWKQDTDT